MNKLLGTVVRQPITAGEPVTQGALVSPGDRGFLAAALGPGMRAVTVPVSEKTGVGGFVFPGDHIDLMLTQTISGNDGTKLDATETILTNLRVLATDQSPVTTTDDDGKTVVKTFRTVTLEVTPKVAEKIAVAQTVGTLSLALRSIADNQADLDKMLATSDVNLPNNLSKGDEDKLLRKVSTVPQAGSDFVTGGDVSRFQRRTMPPMGSQSASTPVAAANPGPVVRIHRGHGETDSPVAKAAGALFGEMLKQEQQQQTAGVGKAAGPLSNSVASGL